MLKSCMVLAALGAAFLGLACSNSDAGNIPLAVFDGFAQNSSGAAANATVTAVKLVNGVPSTDNTNGSIFGPVDTSNNGLFTYSFLDYVGPVHFSVATTPAMTAAFGAIPGGQTSALVITPLTTVATQAAASTGGITTATLASANNRVNTVWLGDMIDTYHTRPLNPLTANDPNAASQAEKFYFFLLGGLNALATDLSITNAALETAMYDDASDGVFDGNGQGGAIAGITATTFTSDLAAQITAFKDTQSVTHDATAFTTFTSAIASFNGTLVTTP